MAKNGLPGPGIWLSVIITLIGATLASVGGWQSFQQTFELLTVDSAEVPGSQTRDLPTGEYEVYGIVAEVSIFNLDDSTFLNEPSFFVDDITVTNLTTNNTVPLVIERSTITLSRSSNVYAPVASFEITDPGEYEISIASDDTSRSVVGRSIQSAPDRIVPWAIMLVVGSILTLIGIAMLITGIVRRSRIKKQAGYTGMNAPAGYAAPQSAGGLAAGGVANGGVPPMTSPGPAPTHTTGAPPPPGATGSPDQATPSTTAPQPHAPQPQAPRPQAPPPAPARPNQDPNQPDTNTPWG